MTPCPLHLGRLQNRSFCFSFFFFTQLCTQSHCTLTWIPLQITCSCSLLLCLYFKTEIKILFSLDVNGFVWQPCTQSNTAHSHSTATQQTAALTATSLCQRPSWWSNQLKEILHSHSRRRINMNTLNIFSITKTGIIHPSIHSHHNHLYLHLWLSSKFQIDPMCISWVCGRRSSSPIFNASRYIKVDNLQVKVFISIWRRAGVTSHITTSTSSLYISRCCRRHGMHLVNAWLIASCWL